MASQSSASGAPARHTSLFRFYLALAFKNLWRHKRRTILTTLAIAVGIFYYIIFDSLMAGIDRDSLQSLFDLEVGHFQVMAAKADTSKITNLKHLVPDASQVAADLRTVSGVKGVAPRLLFPATLLNGVDELPIVGVGVDPRQDGSVFLIRKYVRGQWIREGRAEVVLGKKNADLLQVKVGDPITLRTQTKTNTFQALDLTVAGIVDSPDPVVNEGQIFLPLDVTQQALGTGNAVSEMVVKAVSLKKVPETISKVEKLGFPGFRYRIRTWKEAAASFLAMVEMKRGFQYVLLLLVAAIAIIGVVNSVLLASLERVREIGILKAMGMTEVEITRLFAWEAIGLGFIGGLIGTVIGAAVNLYLVNVGVDIHKFYGNINVGLSIEKMYGAWNPVVIAGAFLFGLAISFLASWIPARSAAKIDPAVSLRKL